MAFYCREAAELQRRASARAQYARFIARRLDRRRLLLRAWALAASHAARFGNPRWTWIGPGLAEAWQERRRHLAAIG